MCNFRLFLISLIISSSFLDAGDPHIKYLIAPNFDSGPSIQVSFEIVSSSDGSILLRYENESWGDKDLFNCLSEVTVVPEAKSVVLDRESSLIIIQTEPNVSSSVSYMVKQDFEGPLYNFHRYRPIIQKEYFHVLGMRLFMTPDHLFADPFTKVDVEIMVDKPKKWDIFHSSFGKELQQRISVTREELYASIFLMGDFRRYSFEYEGDLVYFTTRGDWTPFEDREVLLLLKQAVEAQRSFWNDPRKGIYSVSLLPTEEAWTETSKSYSMGGSGLTQSFISFASNNPGITYNGMRWLYNHELMHNWIGRTIINENDVEQYWFSEGFTEYYTYKLMLRNDYISLQEYLRVLNEEVVELHYKDPLRNAPNSDMTFQNYWSQYGKYGKLPYRRGMLYAFYLDNLIKAKYKGKISLDTPLKDLFKNALSDAKFRFNEAVFVGLLNELLGEPFNEDFGRMILRGELIDFSKSLPEGLRWDTAGDIPRFQIEESADNDALARVLKL